MKRKIRVGVVFGGKSVEHQISLLSAKSIIENLNTSKYEVILIGVDHQGRWLYHQDAERFLEQENDPKKITLNQDEPEVCLIPTKNSGGSLQPLSPVFDAVSIDVVFPVIHGNGGEDGGIQGLLKLANVPCVGSPILGSAITMDKDVTKRLLRAAHIPISDFIVVHQHEWDRLDLAEVEKKLGFPCFVKPANSGSSVGISKVKDSRHLKQALLDAFRYDSKVLIEQFIKGREVECGILGNNDPKASVVGEIITHREFYDYEAKYLDTEGLILEVPASITAEQTKMIQQYSLEAFKVLSCQGMARVDFFLNDQGQLFLNEVNSIPGFTKVSMYPLLWAASGVPYEALLDKLIDLALERHQENAKIERHLAAFAEKPVLV